MVRVEKNESWGNIVFGILYGSAFLATAICGGGISPAKAAACDTFLIGVDLFLAASFFVLSLCLCFVVNRALCSPSGSSESTYHLRRETVIVFCEVLLVFLSIAIGIFGLVVSKGRNGGHVVLGKGYREFKLEDYSHWMRKRVRDERVWKEIKWCLMKREECQKLALQQPDPITGIIHFNGIQSGCCTPPDSCGFAVMNASASIYEVPASSSSPSSPLDDEEEEEDCTVFSNGVFKCFDCDSWKAAFVDTLRRSWRTMSIVNFLMVPGLRTIPLLCGLSMLLEQGILKLFGRLFERCLPNSRRV